MRRRILAATVGIGLCLALFVFGLQAALATGSQTDSVGKQHAVVITNPGIPGLPRHSQIGTTPRSTSTGPYVVSASNERIVLTFETGDYTLADIATPDGSCQEISLPGFQSIAQPGHPALPAAKVALGIPVDAAPSVRVVSSKSVLLPGSFHLCPEPSPVVDADPADGQPAQISAWRRVPDPVAYASDAFLPTDLVDLAAATFVRDQRVAEVLLHPLQYNPVSGQVRLFTHLTVEVILNSPSTRAAVSQAADSQVLQGPFEDLLRAYLLNYHQALPWRQEPADAPLQAAAADLFPAATTAVSPTYRILIKQPGLYALSFADLQAADPAVDLSTLDPRNFHLYSHAQEVAIEVSGEADASFDPGDVIFFFAEAINTVYANTNVYWLSWDATPGTRMASLDATPSGTAGITPFFSTTLSLEEDHAYRSARITADGDHWYWTDLKSTGIPTMTYSFSLPNLATTPLTASLSGDLLGYGADPQHAVQIRLNNHLIYTATWPSATEHLFQVDFPHAFLLTGTNSLAVTIGVGNLTDGVLVNRFALTHGQVYTTSSDLLWFEGDQPGTWEFQLTGFTTDTVKILDISDPKMPIRILPGAALLSGSTYALPFEQDLLEEHRYLAVASHLAQPPLSVVRDAVSDLLSPANGADYIVVSHSDFITAAHTLATYRATQGYRTAVIDVQDIYDQFNFGIPDAEAIRDFLAFAFDFWSPPAPAFVVLMGDGHVDPKDNLGWGEPSPIPPYLADVDPWIRETAADNLFVSVNGSDHFPDMFIGRLPVNSLDQASALVDKLIAYELPSAAGSWQSQFLFVADNADHAGDFAADSDAVADHYVPLPYTVDKVYLGITHPITEPTLARSAILSAINQGRLIVNYAGHSARQYWAGERLLSVDTAPSLTNTHALPFFVPMTCWEGYFIFPSPPGGNYAALAETLVRLPDRGAIASWSATGLGLASGHDYLSRGLYQAFFQDDLLALGPATVFAKQYLVDNTYYYRDLLDTYTLFGDPATRLNALPAPQIQKQIVGERFAPGDVITYTLTYTNAGPTVAHSVVITDSLPAALLSPAAVASGAVITARVGSTYVWDVADLPAHTGGTITITGTIDTSFSGTLANLATIAATSQEGVKLVHSALAATEIAADVNLVKANLGGSVLAPGDRLTYTLTYSNLGTVVARDVVITDIIPTQLAPLSVSSSGASIESQPGHTYVWDVADLSPDAGGTITITGVVTGTLIEVTMTNTATIATSSIEALTLNNSSSVTVTVVPHQVFLPLVLRVSPSP